MPVEGDIEFEGGRAAGNSNEEGDADPTVNPAKRLPPPTPIPPATEATGAGGGASSDSRS